MLFAIKIRSRNGHFEATVPDLPGCTASGPTVDRALSNVHLAIECHVEDLLRAGHPVPQPSAGHGTQDDQGNLYNVHINLRHLRAVAAHQKRSPK